MNQHRKLCVSAFALCVAAFVTGGTVSAAAATKTSVRDKALTECVAEAKSEVPDTYVFTNRSQGNRNVSNAALTVYKDCMRKKGFRP